MFRPITFSVLKTKAARKFIMLFMTTTDILLLTNVKEKTMKCTKCNGEDFEFVESYQYKINVFIKIAILIVLIPIILITFLTSHIAIASVAIIALLAIGLIIKIIEKQMSRKTRTKAICKNCGKTFYLN